MTLSEYAKKEGITNPGAIYRIQQGKVKAKKVRFAHGKMWVIEDPQEVPASANGNGHDKFTIEDVAQQMPYLTVRKALQVLQILNG